MRFQVLNSTVRYSRSAFPSNGQVTLSFGVLPCGTGELEFSDGSRLLGCGDLSQEWGSPLDFGILRRKFKELGHQGIDEKFWPLSTTILITKYGEFTDYKKKQFGKRNKYRGSTEELFKGYASYHSDDLTGKNLRLILIVDDEIFDDLLLIRLDSPAEIFFDVDILGLEDDRFGAWSRWDLDDTSDCGDGNIRVIHDFSIERLTSYFPDDRHYDRRQKERREVNDEFAKLRSLVGDLVAIETGRVDGAVANLLRLNLFALSTIVIIGILALLALYF